MSKISEQRALESYPKAYYCNGGGIDDANASDRAVYEEGYDQAMQDFLEKACEWLEIKIICYSKREYEELIEQFKNYMQNE